MSVGLLLPLALSLGLLVLGPLLAHLARHQPSQRVAFGAMLLLERMTRKVRSRARVKDLWLLLLRMLLVLLVVAAAARPELRIPGALPEVGGSGRVVLVFDASLSMSQRVLGGTAFSAARDRALSIVRSLPQGTLVGLVRADAPAEGLTASMTNDASEITSALESLRPTEASTDLAGGIRLARRLLDGKGGEVVVLTDESGPTSVPAAHDEIALLLQQRGTLRPEVFRAATPENLSIVDARYGEGVEGGSVRLRVANHGLTKREAPCTVHLPDGTEITVFVEVAAGETSETLVTVPRVADGGVGLATVKDDALELDNTFAFHLPRVGASRVLVVDGDPGVTPVASEVYFLERALAPWGANAGSRSGLLPDITSTAGVSTLDADTHRVAFLANVADPGPWADALLRFVRDGGGLVMGLGDNVTADRYNASLAGLLPVRLLKPRALGPDSETSPAVALPDVTTELFAPFARSGRAAFSRMHAHHVFLLEPFDDSDDVHTLLELEGGIPLLVERRIGRGRVLLWTSTWDLGWGNFPLQSAYMPLVQRIVGYLGGEAGGEGERRSARVREAVAVDLPERVDQAAVTGPDGTPVASTLVDGKLVFSPEVAGGYRVATPGAPPLAQVAVNVDPAESDLRPGPPLLETAAQLDPERFFEHVPLAPWMLGLAVVGALVVALVAAPKPDGEQS